MFRSGLHEFLTEFIEPIEPLGDRDQRASI